MLVDGGGLCQTPTILRNLPHYPVASPLGTTQISSMAGSSLAAYNYARQVKFNYLLLAACAHAKIVNLATNLASIISFNTTGISYFNMLSPWCFFR
ncbi:hypothetical protein [Pedobacter zeae]|uniref:Uncharacterized protein n=1 Tax=Pedobacter zeae TaxID=1737356 RepID=A0A7W6KAS7_9SPHI|nr:hypothetical protein [Pedobacter zeae]MBB4107285.1 hypothetical protein [Pedobacter zeae]GGH06879.1 hypothetical protein GCM10007422_23790 [Pedobacter zeae]